MDSRDSSASSSSLAVASRDGCAPPEDDAVTSVTSALAKEAFLLFQSRKFGECVDLLNQLAQKKAGDPKVFHNIAIAEYFRDGCSDPKKLLGILNNLKMKSEEIACAPGESPGIISGSKGNNSVAHQFSGANSANIVYNEEFDSWVTTLNIAVIHFHLHDYVKALSILEPLYKKIARIDEATSLHICLLLLDVALASNDTSKSADVVTYVEKTFELSHTTGQGDSGTIVSQPPPSPVAKSSPSPVNQTVQDVLNPDSSTTVTASESLLSRTLSEETLDYENLLSTLDIGGRNLSRPTGLPTSNDPSRTQDDRSIATLDLKLKVHLYKVRLLLLVRNLKAAKREVKLAMNIARGRDSSMALLLKSQLEYARGNHRKAIKLLMASSNRTETATSSIFHNNLGCIHYQLGKHHTSTVFFSKALTNSSSLQKDKPLKLLSFSQDKSLLIVYNCGVQYLACGKPILAARCFQKASLVFYDRPLLWVRLAECCLMALEKGLLRSSSALSDRSGLSVHVVGQGNFRHLLLEDGVSRNGENGFSKDDRQPRLSLPFAKKCLLNALHLINSTGSKSPDSDLPSNITTEENLNPNRKASNFANGVTSEHKGVSSLQATLQSSLSDYEDMCRKEKEIIKQTIYANLAYVELKLENPLKALAFAMSLLNLPELSRIYAFMGHIYAAEALCLLNRPDEAAEQLSIYLNQGQFVDTPYHEEDRELFKIEKTLETDEMKNSYLEESQGIVFLKPDEARGVLYVNFAALAAMKGEVEQAHRFAAQALSALPNKPEAVAIAIYVDLALGKKREALDKLKMCSHVRFVRAS